jgi:hypothetical protein
MLELFGWTSRNASLDKLVTNYGSGRPGVEHFIGQSVGKFVALTRNRCECQLMKTTGSGYCSVAPDFETGTVDGKPPLHLSYDDFTIQVAMDNLNVMDLSDFEPVQ